MADDNLLETLEAAPMGDPAATDAGPEDPPPIEEEPEAIGGLLVTLCHRAEDHFGLRIAECDAPGAPAAWGPVHHVHAAHSLHYAHRAADISGLSQNMIRFTTWVAANHGPRLAELIHNPGGSIKNGQTVNSTFWGTTTWNAHANHVHLAV